MAREMKDSGIDWIGEIPRHWDVRPIKNSFSIVSGSTPDSDKAEYWEGDIPWITPADFKTIDKYTSGGSRFITEKGYDSCSTNMIPKGSIIFSKRAPIGSVVINKIDLCTNQGCLSCIKNDKTDSAYFYYLMSIYDDVFNLFGSGTTFKEISATTFGDFILPLPPLVEQQLVSSSLDSKCAEIDKAIETTKASIEEYRKLRQAIITEAVTKGLDPDVEMKDSGIEWIGKIPKHWNRTKIKNGCDLLSSGTTPASGHEEYYLNGTINWIQSGDLYNNPIISSVSKRITPKAFDNTPSLKVYTAPFIVVAMYGASVGNVSISEIDACCNQACCCIKTNEKLSLKFLMYWLVSCKKDFLVKSSGGGQPNISQQIIQNEVLLIPSKEEQHRIASFLDSKCSEIDSLIKSKEKLIEELTAYRKSLIYEYVTGKKEVPIESA